MTRIGQNKRKFDDVMDSERSASTPQDVSNGPAEASVAATLRQARLRAGYDLRDVAETLRIRRVYLEAIEDARFGDLPGPVYAIGFVRGYAELLGLPGEELVLRFKDEIANIPNQTSLHFPEPVPEGRVPGGALLLIALLLALGAYGGWYYLSAKDRAIADVVPALPERFAVLLSNQTADPDDPAGALPPAMPDAMPEDGAEVVPEWATDAPLTAAEAPEAPAPATDPAPPAPAESARTLPAPAPVREDPPAPAAAAETGDEAYGSDVYAAEEGGDAVPAVTAEPAPPPAPPAAEVAALPPAAAGSGIVITATAQSWVQVRNAEGDLIMTRVLEPGETYRVPDVPGLRMVTGNAGGIRITVNGVEAPSLGNTGDVVRNVILEGDRLLAGTAARRR